MNNLIASGLISLVKSLETLPMHLTTKDTVFAEPGVDLEWKVNSSSKTLTMSCGLEFSRILNMTPLIALMKLSARYSIFLDLSYSYISVLC
jgi:hypothetical protein